MKLAIIVAIVMLIATITSVSALETPTKGGSFAQVTYSHYYIEYFSDGNYQPTPTYVLGNEQITSSDLTETCNSSSGRHPECYVATLTTRTGTHTIHQGETARILPKLTAKLTGTGEIDDDKDHWKAIWTLIPDNDAIIITNIETQPFQNLDKGIVIKVSIKNDLAAGVNARLTTIDAGNFDGQTMQVSDTTQLPLGNSVQTITIPSPRLGEHRITISIDYFLHDQAGSIKVPTGQEMCGVIGTQKTGCIQYSLLPSNIVDITAQIVPTGINVVSHTAACSTTSDCPEGFVCDSSIKICNRESPVAQTSEKTNSFFGWGIAAIAMILTLFFIIKVSPKKHKRSL